MIIIGSLLLVATVIFGAEFVFANHHHFTNPTVFGQSLGLSNDASVFIVGVITGTSVLVGLALVGAGMRHKATKAVTHHRERKDAKGTRSERDQLAEQNEELRRKLSLQRSAPRADQKARPLSGSTSPIEGSGASRLEAEDATD
jgi:hypothetical protein